MKKVLCAVLIMFMALALSGCSEIKISGEADGTVFAETESITCSMASAVFRLMEIKESYETTDDAILWERKIDGISMAEYAKAEALDELLKWTAAEAMASEMAIFLTSSELDSIKKEAASSLAELGTIYDLGEFNITLSDVEDLYKKQSLYEKVYDKLSENVTMEISESDTKVIEVNYVTIPKSAKYEEVQELRNALKTTNDFKGTCAEYGYNAVMNMVLKHGEMDQSFESMAYALKDGELSEIVTTQDCYYIIQCLEDYMVAESVANNNDIISSARREKFEEAYAAYADEHQIKINSSAWKMIELS